MTAQYQEDLRTVVVDHSTSGDNIIIAAPTSPAYIAIDHINLIPTTAVTVTFYSGASSGGATKRKSGPYPLDAKQPMTLENAQHNQKGVITCNSGESFNINLGSAVQIGGFIRYRVVGQ